MGIIKAVKQAIGGGFADTWQEVIEPDNIGDQTGSSVVDLLRKARLAKARRLLETRSMSVSEVAYEVGFSAPSYFTKCFKEEYGMLPGDVGNVMK